MPIGANIDAIARTQLTEVRKRLHQLKALENELKRMISCCEGGRVETCRILSTLNDHDECIADVHERPMSL